MFDLSQLNSADFKADMERRIEEARRSIEAVCTRYESQVIHYDDFGSRVGPFHASSILSWTKIAKLAGIPYIPASPVAIIPTRDVWTILDGGTIPAESLEEFSKASDYANNGGFWRTDLCAGEDVKYHMGSGHPLPEVIPINFDDPRIMDLNVYMSNITIVKRPRVTPRIVNGYSVEFRVFLGGKAAPEGAVSFYYPQTPHFEVDGTLEAAMDTAFEYAKIMDEKRKALCLIPWLPERGDPNEAIGSTIDFMLTSGGNVVLVDAGPGFGYGAHPCCFLDVPVQGKRWYPPEGADIR